MSQLKEQVLERLDVREPSMYRVIMINDHYTTMDFVIMVLMVVFHRSHDDAQRIMMDVHKNGQGLAGVYPYEVAETKVRQVEELAETHCFPLRCTMEEE